jgi:hypothetical protein
MTKIQNAKQNPFSRLNIGAWNLFGVWDLEFGIYF